MLSAHPNNNHIHQPSAAQANTKASLKAWWNHFNFVQRAKKDSNYIREHEKGLLSPIGPPPRPHSPTGAPEDHPVFGKPLHESLQYASVPISTASPQGDLYVWGFVPVVVAKWSVLSYTSSAQDLKILYRSGLYLKENGT